jgi:hypothetical protein
VKNATSRPAAGSWTTPRKGGALLYRPDPQADGVYIFGHNRVHWIDWAGALIFRGRTAG